MVKKPVEAPKVEKSEEQWRAQLTDLQYWVTREAGTERPFTGEYNFHKEAGRYVCVCCGADLFDSNTKFDSGCGWPSFDRHIKDENVTLIEDYSHGMQRVEVRCAQCDAHLGHVFDDGPTETGQRYCINSASLGFTKS